MKTTSTNELYGTQELITDQNFDREAHNYKDKVMGSSLLFMVAVLTGFVGYKVYKLWRLK